MKKDFLISQGWHTQWNENNWVYGSDYNDMSGYSLDEAYEIAIKYQKIKKMKKYQTNPNNAVYMAIVTAITAVWVITLFILMWYDKEAVRVANTDYVRECVRWPGHTKISNYPVEYE